MKALRLHRLRVVSCLCAFGLLGDTCRLGKAATLSFEAKSAKSLRITSPQLAVGHWAGEPYPEHMSPSYTVPIIMPSLHCCGRSGGTSVLLYSFVTLHGVYLHQDERKEVGKVASGVAARGDIVPPGMERKGLGDTGHFDAVWMKEGMEGRGGTTSKPKTQQNLFQLRRNQDSPFI